MEDYGVITATDTIRFERVLPGPIERVWAYITESDKRATWLARGPMEVRVGGLVDLTWHNSQLSAENESPEDYRKYDGHNLKGRVTRCEPPHLISFTWPGESGHESEVSFELSSRGKDVILVLTHARLPNRTAMLGVSGGWHAHVGILVDQLNGVTPRPFWTTHQQLKAAYEKRLADQ